MRMPAIVPVQKMPAGWSCPSPRGRHREALRPNPRKCHPEREGSLPAGAPNAASGNFNDDTGLDRGHSFVVSSGRWLARVAPGAMRRSVVDTCRTPTFVSDERVKGV